ncbi:hypothetical protein Agabi119p4_398 [Agaricus bisporus var. burnettii]|uniref:Uncharacterized protein n=1 Tax=Agaricus bisporus var. burnettii TaxID=192524 RepID=A0A8H7FAV2_AGABI|nr:hypothetical protein Agabi119p4_398 [Agaricus bisporus var. burnettii]
MASPVTRSVRIVTVTQSQSLFLTTTALSLVFCSPSLHFTVALSIYPIQFKPQIYPWPPISPELKTKDIQNAFAEFENQNGGFKIKWKDDTSLLIVFQDPVVAKRAYLQTLAFPPPALAPSSGQAMSIRPYDGLDAQAIIHTVNSRGQHSSSASRSHTARSASISVFPNARSLSGAGNPSFRGLNASTSNSSNIAIPEHPNGRDREPSPTLPSLPSHPTLNSLISSSLGVEF